MIHRFERRNGVGAGLICEAEVWTRGEGAPKVALVNCQAAGFYNTLGHQGSAVFYKKIIKM
jgi:GNAT superfamily N-acetyltransferase